MSPVLRRRVVLQRPRAGSRYVARSSAGGAGAGIVTDSRCSETILSTGFRASGRSRGEACGGRVSPQVCTCPFRFQPDSKRHTFTLPPVAPPNAPLALHLTIALPSFATLPILKASECSQQHSSAFHPPLANCALPVPAIPHLDAPILHRAVHILSVLARVPGDAHHGAEVHEQLQFCVQGAGLLVRHGYMAHLTDNGEVPEQYQYTLSSNTRCSTRTFRSSYTAICTASATASSHDLVLANPPLLFHGSLDHDPVHILREQHLRIPQQCSGTLRRLAV